MAKAKSYVSQEDKLILQSHTDLSVEIAVKAMENNNFSVENHTDEIGKVAVGKLASTILSYILSTYKKPL